MLSSGVFLQNLDRSVRPQDDFYGHVNGQWLSVTTIPSDRSNYGAFTLLQDSAERNLQVLLQECEAAAGSFKERHLNPRVRHAHHPRSS